MKVQASGAGAAQDLRAVLTAEERRALQARSDWKGAWVVFRNYALTAAILAVMALWPNPITILVGIVLLGGRQLGFGVIVHECGHGTLFRTRALNEFVGLWLAAAPTFNNMKAYARGHLEHHRLAGTREDPDLPNYQEYPIGRKRLLRKLWRDVTGRTGWKQTRGLFRNLFRLHRLRPETRNAILRGLVVNALFVAVLGLLGAVWLYAVWWVALLTSNRVVSRLRQVAEHAAVPDLYDPDPRCNTRTIPAGWFDALVFCPLGVNYHLEHHFMASVPIYNLPKMHRMLKRRGFYEGVAFPPSYFSMLRGVTTPA